MNYKISNTVYLVCPTVCVQLSTVGFINTVKYIKFINKSSLISISQDAKFSD